MNKYTPKEFNIPEIKGISKSQIDEHLKLYNGYVKNLNTVHEIVENPNLPEYARRETYRRLGFEFDGMRNHEFYFGALEGGSKELTTESPLYKEIEKSVGSLENFLTAFKSLTTTRGIGWAMLGYDTHTKQLTQYWADEHHLGQLTTVQPVLALDCWEHAYMVDYLPGERGKYVEAYLNALNWDIVNGWFEQHVI